MTSTSRPDGRLSYRLDYLDTARRLADLALKNADRLDRRVAACPEWSCRDLLGHLVGIAEDWVNGTLDRYASESWTEAQIDRHRGDGLDELVGEWASALDRLDQVVDHPVMGGPWRWLFGDALTHESDLYQTLSPRVRPPPDAVAAGLTSMMGRWRQHLVPAELPPLLVKATGLRDWWIGEPGENNVTLTADPYLLWRFLYGRLDRSSVESLEWSADPTTFLDRGLPYPFTFPSSRAGDAA